ncbi:alpha/beta hydrolase [Chloroflexota bacterium]
MSTKNLPTPIKNPRRLYRLTAFTLVSLLAGYLAINFGLAWIYAYALTHPPCSGEPRPVEGHPPPQEIELHTEDELALRAWYYPPQNGAAILAIDGPCGSLGSGVPPLGFLLDQGYGALQVDSRAHATPKAPVTLGGKEIYDLKAGLDYLLARPEVGTVGAYGFSMGGVTIIRAAARYPQIAAVVAEGGYYNLGLDFVEPDRRRSPPGRFLQYSIAWAFWAASGVNPWTISPIDDLPAISPRPVLLIYGEHELAAGRGLIQFEAAREPKELWIVPGGGHGSNHLAAPQEYRLRVGDFFEQYLLDN